MLPRSSPRLALLVCACLALGTALSLAQAAYAADTLSYRPSDPLNLTAFDHFYNLDYDRAVQEFDQVLQRHPDDPFAVNHLLTAVLFRELYRMGALNTGEYANDSFIHAPHHKADPRAQQRIKQLVDRALKLEEKRLKADPNDIDALYARGVTRAQFCTYTALIEHAWFSALRNAVGARHDHERVLELAPNDVQAKLIVGAHNYVIGSLPWGVKAGASIVGLSGNKEKGIKYLQECAAGGGETSVDAKILLVLFLRREHRYDEALPIARALIASYPQDVLMALEEGNLLRAAGKDQDAATVYRNIWQAGHEGHFPGLHYEIAALSLGDLLRAQKDYSGAAAAYEQVSQVPQPDPEVLQKANLGAGEMYDLLQRRNQAVAKYQAVIAANASTPPAETARKRMKDAYRE
ncbi:MAG TPA: tetratricopeptide repeat protein [Terriglobales bacterium]|nr:tetratricopeptide repeat protein [Terriglobales bacterium]